MFSSNKPIFLFAFTVLLLINNGSTDTTTVPADNDDTSTTPVPDDDEATRASRIVGGEIDRYGEVKYAVALHDGYQNFCGGSIIGERFVLTAAHCVIGLDNRPAHYLLYALVGGTNVLLRDFRDRVPKVEKIFVPSSFDGSHGAIQFGDIAVLRLDRPVRLLDDFRIAKVNLPENLPFGSWDDFEGQTATISGFGAEIVARNPNDGTVRRYFPGHLKVSRAGVMRQRECEDIFSGFINIHMAHMCARMVDDGHRGVCTGDAGNGLVWYNTIIGVASFGNQLCDEDNAPTVYTRVVPYVEFIELAMANAPSGNLRVYYMFK